MPYEESPLFQSPPDDEVIWKYMDLPKFLIMLEQRSLYFALIREFEDKWEAVISRDLSKGIQTVSGSASGTVIKNYQEVFECLGIDCWYAGKDESIAMWRLYTKDYYGVAIKSTVGHLKRALAATKKAVLIGRVEYCDYTEIVSHSLVAHSPSPFTAVLQKRTCYKHECEIRAITQAFQDYEVNTVPGVIDLASFLPKHGVSLPIDLSILIQSITTGPNFPKWTCTLLTSALSRAALNIRIVESYAFKEPEARYVEP